MYSYKTRRGSQAPNARWPTDDEARAAKETVKERRGRGDTYAEIAKDLGVGEKTIRRMDQGQSYREED